ncbi:MAG: 50S ribosomal protein L25/general stress protein Ctc [Parcubacteria group bacterium]
MAEIVLNVEVRERTGTGAARDARRQQKVPGVLYGGPKGPVAVAVRQNEFRKALYTGKLLGHLVTLRHGNEDQPVIAKDVQFHPVTDEPIHFDLYRVEEGQEIHINVPVHFRNEEASPGIKQGGSLEVVRHDLELVCRADRIPEEIVVDLTGKEIGDVIHLGDIALPAGVRSAVADPELVIATLKISSAAQAEDAEAAAAASGGEAPEEEGASEE